MGRFGSCRGALRPFWVLIIVAVRRIVHCERFSGFRADVSCCTTKIHSINTIQTNRHGRICLLNLIVAEFECKHRVCACSLVVVRQIIYCQRFSDYRADVSCCITKIYLTSAIQTGRCGRICLFNLTVAEFECKYRVCECSLVVVRRIVYSECFSCYRADVSCFTNKMCLVSTIQTNRCGRICLFKLIVTKFE